MITLFKTKNNLLALFLFSCLSTMASETTMPSETYVLIVREEQPPIISTSNQLPIISNSYIGISSLDQCKYIQQITQENSTNTNFQNPSINNSNLIIQNLIYSNPNSPKKQLDSSPIDKNPINNNLRFIDLMPKTINQENFNEIDMDIDHPIEHSALNVPQIVVPSTTDLPAITNVLYNQITEKTKPIFHTKKVRLQHLHVIQNEKNLFSQIESSEKELNSLYEQRINQKQRLDHFIEKKAGQKSYSKTLQNSKNKNANLLLDYEMAIDNTNKLIEEANQKINETNQKIANVNIKLLLYKEQLPNTK